MELGGVLIPDGTVQLEVHEYIEELRIIGCLDPPDLPENLGSELEDGITRYIVDAIEKKAKGE